MNNLVNIHYMLIYVVVIKNMKTTLLVDAQKENKEHFQFAWFLKHDILIEY